MTTITADLTVGLAVELRAGNHVWVADEPIEVGGTDTGPNPYEMLLSAVAACTCITLSMYCRRKGWALHSISAKYEFDRVHADDCDDCEDDAEGRIDRVRSEIFIEGEFDEAQRTRLTDIAQKCPVHKTIAHGVGFTTECVFVG
jgi:uncharacterized OsmC-like protein